MDTPAPAPATPVANEASAAQIQLITPPVKPGIKTSEFWVTLLASVGAMAAAAGDVLPPKWAALCAAGSTVAYVVSRGLAKRQTL